LNDRFDCWAEVDLGKIRRNILSLSACIQEGADLMAVVKANAYGHGILEVANAAVRAGASWLGVARVDEGRILRKAGVTAPTLLLAEPPIARCREVLELGLTATIYTEQCAQTFSEAASSLNMKLDVHVKIDTGMHRYGIAPENAGTFMNLIDSLSGIEATGIWTHFATAEETDNPFTKQQYERFVEVLDDLAPRSDGMIRHAANSAALISFPESHLDLVRAGISIYGIHPSPIFQEKIELESALSLKARIGQVKWLPEGESLSYGSNYSLKRPSWVATVPAGYADGVPRSLTNSGEILIGGRRHMISGNVTMDHIMVDLGDRQAELGDEAVLIGLQGNEEITVQEVADRLGTIPYEVLTQVGARVPRIYMKDDS
jgi:alanine racemase